MMSGCTSSTSPGSEGPQTEFQTEFGTGHPGSELPRYAHNQPDDEVDTPDPLQNKTTRNDINVSSVEYLLGLKLNDYRTTSEVNRLVRDPRLARIARHHSYDMATRNFFNHTNPDGETFSDRVQNSNYACGGGGENIAMVGWKTDSAQTEEELAELIMRGFIESPEHNTGMLRPNLTTVGIEIYVREDGRTYATMDLCEAHSASEGDE